MSDLLDAQRRVFTLSLKPTEKLVALALLNHWSRTRSTFPSVTRLAAWTSLSERTVKTALASLERAGIVAVSRKKGVSNVYDLRALLSGKVAKTSAGAAPVTSATVAPVQELPLTSAGAAPVPVQELPPKRSNEVIQEEIQIDRETARRWTRVPSSWEPNDAHQLLAKDLGLDLTDQVERFRDHEFKAPKRDADATFRTWLRNAKAFSRAPSAQRAAPQRGLAAHVRTGTFMGGV